MNTTRVCLSWLAAASACLEPLGAHAAASEGISPSSQAQATTAPAIPSDRTIPATPDPRSRVIFSNLGRGTVPAYDCCYLWGITGPAAENGDATAVGLSFRPAKNARLTRVELGLSYLSGTNQVTVSIHEDAGSAPGPVLAQFLVADLPRVQSCCELARVNPGGLPVRAGALYWVTVRAEGNTLAGWNVALPVMFGPLGLDRGAGWVPYFGVQPSLQVLGR